MTIDINDFVNSTVEKIESAGGKERERILKIIYNREQLYSASCQYDHENALTEIRKELEESDV